MFQRTLCLALGAVFTIYSIPLSAQLIRIQYPGTECVVEPGLTEGSYVAFEPDWSAGEYTEKNIGMSLVDETMLFCPISFIGQMNLVSGQPDSEDRISNIDQQNNIFFPFNLDVFLMVNSEDDLPISCTVYVVSSVADYEDSYFDWDMSPVKSTTTQGMNHMVFDLSMLGFATPENPAYSYLYCLVPESEDADYPSQLVGYTLEMGP